MTDSTRPGGVLRQGARCGVARVPLRVPKDIPMAGYSLMGRSGQYERWPLHARAMFLEDDEGHAIAFVMVDLMSASRYLHERVAALTRQLPCRLDVHQLVLLGTHTHTAPGGFFGNSLYDTLAQKQPFFRRELAEGLARAIVKAIEEAWRSARPARVALQVARVWGASRNRSLGPFLDNPLASRWNLDPSLPGHGGGGLSPQQRSVDPRVTILSAFDEQGARLGVLATFGCHNTALGLPRLFEVPYYAPDWTGFAASLVEADGQRGVPVALVGLSAAGDVTPMPPDDDLSHYMGPRRQGEELARFVGGEVAEAIFRAGSPRPELRPITLRSWYEDWAPTPGSEIPGEPATRLAHWQIGAPALAGAEDGRSLLYPWAAWEGMVGEEFGPADPQHPKAPAFGILGKLLRQSLRLRPSPTHALHVVNVAGHVFATVPGEPTTCAAFQIESAVREATGAASVSVLGYAGDYAGYFTTREEYGWQYYEGASTLYGSESTRHLGLRLARLVKTQPFLCPPREVAPFEVAAPLPAAPEGVEALSSGGHLQGRHASAWWAWPVEQAPREKPEAYVELRPSAGAAVSRRVAASEVYLLEHSLLGRELCLWVAEFELEAPAEGQHLQAVCYPPAPFKAPAVTLDRPNMAAPVRRSRNGR